MLSRPLVGIFPPIPTPFDDHGDLALDHLRSNLARWCATGLHGFVVLGSNGEFPLLTTDEKLAVWEAARAAIPPHLVMLAGSGMESTRATIDLTRRATHIGVDAAIIVTPSYYKPRMDGDALMHHYLAVAEASPIPIVMYNVPAFTGIDIPLDTVLRLAEHPNIIGIKDSGGNMIRVSEMVAGVRPDFSVLAGTGSMIYATLCCGGRGAVAALANVVPQECVAIYTAYQDGHYQEARRRQERLLALNAAVTARFGVPGLKYALDLLGYYGGPARPPLRPASEEARAAIRSILYDLDLLASRGRSSTD